MSELTVTNLNDVAFAQGMLNKLHGIEEIEKKMKAEKESLKAELLKAMEEHGVKCIDAPTVRITFTAEHTTKRLNSKQLKADMPEIYEAYMAESTVAPSIKVTFRDAKLEN